MQNRMYRPEYRHIIVCVDGYEENIIRGRISSSYTAEPVEFRGLMNLILGVEDILEKMYLPENGELVRMFLPQTESDDRLPELPRQSGSKATFLIRVLFRQNASWQGSIIWMEGKTEQSFRSMLELALLLHSALRLEGRDIA